MNILAHLAQLAEPWAALYGGTPIIQTATTFAHFGGFLLGGGFAITADTAILRAAVRSGEARRRRQLAYVRGIHRVVLVGLALTVASGVLMLGADLEAFLLSPIFWVKMALVVLLLANGALMTATDSRLRVADADLDAGWHRLRRAAGRSLGLWFAAVLAGTLLINGGQ